MNIDNSTLKSVKNFFFFFEIYYKSLNITPLLKFNKSTLNALDKAYTLLDCQSRN